MPASLYTARKAVAKADDLLVIGDASGDEVGEWVDLWAQDLGRQRQVTVHFWNSVDGAGSASAPVIYGVGRPLNIWNLSSPAAKVDYESSIAQVPVKPGAFLLNIGHDRGRSNLLRTVKKSQAAVSARGGRVTTAWVLQNPTTVQPKAQESAVSLLPSLALRERIPVVDAHAAIEKSGPLRALLADGIFPTPPDRGCGPTPWTPR